MRLDLPGHRSPNSVMSRLNGWTSVCAPSHGRHRGDDPSRLVDIHRARMVAAASPSSCAGPSIPYDMYPAAPMETESQRREIAGALARFWSGGSGPSDSSISTAFDLAEQ
jgi:hypothetical protein